MADEPLTHFHLTVWKIGVILFNCMHTTTVLKYACGLWVISLGAIPAGLMEAASLREEAMAYRLHGYEAQQRDDGEVALTWYQKAAILDPSYATPYNDMGVWYATQGRLEDARRAYEDALSRRPDYPEALSNAAMFYERMGRERDAAYYWFRRAEVGGASDPGVARATERLQALGITFPGEGPRVDGHAPVLPPVSAAVSAPEDQHRRVIGEAMAAQTRSIETFQALTGGNGEW